MTQKTVAKKPTCSHCQGHDFLTKQWRLGPAELDIRQPTQWLGTVMTAYVCTRCGHVEWFADQAR
ncbi:MAG: hypothetical protein ACRDHY_16725 [Anaerolineales bacterium]